MTMQAVSDVIERVVHDEAFRERLKSNPDAALADYDLSPEERAAFDVGRVGAERLDPRISKSDLSGGVVAKTSTTPVPPPKRSG